MVTEQIGYRRLYDSIACSLEEIEEYGIKSNIGDLDIRVYIGPKPRLGIAYNNNKGKYVIPGEYSPVFDGEIMGDATASSYPRNFFTEIICIKDVEVSNEISNLFHLNDKNGQNELLSLAKRETDVFNRATDLIAGTIGLRFHRQFVLELICENFFCIKGPDDWPYQIYSQALEILDGISLTKSGMKVLSENIDLFSNAEDIPRRYASSAFSWLLRAWTEHDPISKFFAFFIPIEIALTGVTGDPVNEEARREKLNKIIDITSKYAGDDLDELTDFLNNVSGYLLHPSLSSRFGELAKEAKIPGWENDIKAFKKFNSMRNRLLHRGDYDINLSLSISEEEIRTLEDIAERYVNWIFFRDESVYLSRFRPERI